MDGLATIIRKICHLKRNTNESGEVESKFIWFIWVKIIAINNGLVYIEQRYFFIPYYEDDF